MKIDKKRALYQHYKKLQDKYENRRLFLGLVKPFLGFIWFFLLGSNIGSPFQFFDTSFFNPKSFKKEVFKLDSMRARSGGNSTFYTNYFILAKDTILPLSERKKVIYTKGGDFDYFGYFEFLGKEKPKNKYILDEYLINEEVYHSIPFWVNEKTKYMFAIQENSPNEIDFTMQKISFALFVLSFPFLFFVIGSYNYRYNRWKERSEDEIKKAYEEWENYSSYK